LAIRIAARFSPKAKQWVKGRKKIHYKLYQFNKGVYGKRIWFHCASLGEFEQGRPLLERIKKQHPDYKIILTFFSPSGYEVRHKYDLADYVSYLPLDTSYDAEKFIRLMDPHLVIWVKYEFWYHYLHELNRRHIPVVLISSIFRPDHIFFRWFGALHRTMLTYFTHIFVQNSESQQLLKGINISSDICNDTRFDRVYDILQQRRQFETLSLFKGDKKLLIAGSTWQRDADIICDLINSDQFDKDFKFIIASHDVSKDNIYYITDRLKKRKALFSRVTMHNYNDYDVIIVDNIGMLASLYGYADVAYVGGGFNASVHNVLEPAVFGMPVIFGPNHQKSNEAKALLAEQVAFTISDLPSLCALIEDLLANNEAKLNTAKEKSRQYVRSNIGGTDMIYQYLIGNKLI
jgi:3-deoxy-D-manno-octulosonic-acid transferase